MSRQTLLDEFMESVVPVTESGCWMWVGAASPQESTDPNSDLESRSPDKLSWEIHFGTIPHGMMVCHKCTVQCCVNPSHLYLAPDEGVRRRLPDAPRPARGTYA